MIPGKSPLTPLFQRGEFLPFAKGGQEGFSFQCLHNYGLINKKYKNRTIETIKYFFPFISCLSNDYVFFSFSNWQSVSPLKPVNG